MMFEVNKSEAKVVQDESVIKIWYKSGNDYYLQPKQDTDVNKLPVGVYRLEKTIMGLCLSYQGEAFTLPDKIYGITDDFIQRVIKSWNYLNSNMGILLWGIKGTSKTVTAKIICNLLKLPVVIVPFNAGTALTNFIDEIPDECVVLIDEFEKIFGTGNSYRSSDDDETNGNGNISSLLSLMDGTATSTFRRLIILTTNTIWIDKNLISRPGRLRYSKEFKQLPESIVVEIVDDLLDKELVEEFRNDLLSTIGKLAFITVDAVKAFTQEVNIHRILPSVLIEDFNLEQKLDKYCVVRQKVDENYKPIFRPDDFNKGEEVVGYFYPSQMSIEKFAEHHEEDSFYLKRKRQGTIVRVVSETQAIVAVDVEYPVPSKSGKKNEKLTETVTENYLYTYQESFLSKYDYQ